ncbi:MAG: rod shape-determining protein MreD [Nitriliruptoraceae bacterium]
MIARTLLVGLLLLTAVVLETSLFPALTLFGFRPDLLLLLTVVLALRDGPVTGARVGAAAGLLGDVLLSGAPVGLGMLVLTVVGALVGWSRPYLSPTSVSAPIALTAAASLLGTAAIGVLTALLAEEPIGGALVVQASVAVGVYNALLAPLALLVARRLGEAFPLRSAGLD